MPQSLSQLLQSDISPVHWSLAACIGQQAAYVNKGMNQARNDLERSVASQFLQALEEAPLYARASLKERFIDPRFEEQRNVSLPSIIFSNILLERGTSIAKEIFSGSLDPRFFFREEKQKYDEALVLLYKAIPRQVREQVTRGDGTRIIPENFPLLPTFEKAQCIRAWLEEKSGLNGEVLGGVRELNFKEEPPSYIPEEVAHLPNLSKQSKDMLCSSNPFLSTLPSALKPARCLLDFAPARLMINAKIQIKSPFLRQLPEELQHAIYQSLWKKSGSPTLPREISFTKGLLQWGNVHADDDLLYLKKVVLFHLFQSQHRVFFTVPPEQRASEEARISETDFHRICHWVWVLHGKPEGVCNDWGERNLFSNFAILQQANLLCFYEKLTEKEKETIDFMIWAHDGYPKGDPLYGKHHRFDNLVVLSYLTEEYLMNKQTMMPYLEPPSRSRCRALQNIRSYYAYKRISLIEDEETLLLSARTSLAFLAMMTSISSWDVTKVPPGVVYA